MKTKNYFIIILLLISTLISCSKSYVGTYISEHQDSKSYIELKSDGSFLLFMDIGIGIGGGKGGMGKSGKYEIEDNVITLKYDIGFFERGNIDKNVINNIHGDNWVKK